MERNNEQQYQIFISYRRNGSDAHARVFYEKLKEIGYDRTLIIEREIWGEQQIKDINDTKIYLEELIG